MQQFYLHSEVLSTGHKQNVRAMTLEGSPVICLSNDQHLELYQYAARGITFTRAFPFLATIAHLQVLPNKHHDSDYLFLLDRKGRYAFWSLLGGLQYVQNAWPQNPEHSNLFQTNAREGQNSHFCSQSHRFDVLDTKGWICFNLDHSVVVIEYLINSRGLSIERKRTLPVELIRFRQVGCLQSSKHARLVGLLEHNEEKTLFRIYNVDKIQRLGRDNHIELFEKINLLEFMQATPNEVLLLSSNELILAHVQPFAVISRFKIHDTDGKLVSLGQHLYGYIGQELILIDQTNLKNYGSLSLDGRSILHEKGASEISFLRQLEDGGRLISIATNYHQLYFIILYENTWSCCKKMTSLCPIFSVKETANPNCFVTVTNTADNTYSVSLVEKEFVARVTKEEDYPCLVEKIFSLHSGKMLLICSKYSNNLLSLNESTLNYELCRPELPGEVIAANDFFYVTTTTVFAWDQTRLAVITLTEDSVELAEIKDNYAVYLNNDKEVKEIDLPANQVRNVRKGSESEYAWALIGDLSLIVADSMNRGQLLRFKGGQLIEKIGIRDDTIISKMALCNVEEGVLAIGYVDGGIELLNIGEQTRQRFECFVNQAVQFFTIDHSQLGVLIGTKQYILSKFDQYHCQQVQLSYNYNPVHAVAYCPVLDRLIMAETSPLTPLLASVDFASVRYQKGSPLPEFDYRMTPLFESKEDIPIVYLEGRLLFVAVKEKVIVMCLAAKKTVKVLENYFNDVIGIEAFPSGLMVYGIDQLNRNILSMISLEDLEVKASVNLILKENKYIKSIKVLPGNQNITFACRGEKYTTVYELSDNYEPSELYQIKSDYQGYSLELEHSNRLLAMTDSYKFLAVFSYDQAITPLSRFVNSSEINDFSMLSRSVMLGDKAGQITILQYNVENPHDALKMLMTKVGSLKVAEQVSAITKTSPTSAFYGTFEGKVGRITVIDEPTFRWLRDIQKKILTVLSSKSQFDYQKWRHRQMKEDKLIDGRLIELWLRRGIEKGRLQQEWQEPGSKQKDYGSVFDWFHKLSY